jgi:hypothetical protein
VAKNENWEKRRTKIIASNRNPRGQNEDLGLHSHSKTQEIYHEFSVHVTSLMNTIRPNPRWKRGK